MGVPQLVPFVALLAFILILLRRFRKARTTDPGSGLADGDATYVAYVRVRVRTTGTARPFVSLRNGFGGIQLRVSGRSIKISAAGPLRRAGGALGLEHRIDAPGATMSIEEMGWLSTPLFARECIVLSTSDDEEFAIRPSRRPLAALWSALRDAGVHAGQTHFD